MSTILTLTIAQLRMYLRDRQSLVFSLFFPLMLMFAFGFMNFAGDGKTDIGIVTSDAADTTVLDALEANDLFDVTIGTEAEMRAALEDNRIMLALFLPARADSASGQTQALDVLYNAADAQTAFRAIAVLESALTGLEHEIRGTAPLFSIALEDIDARAYSYINFLVPGLLALMLMQLAITGSGFNIVEYKRKGILKRLFVTPLQPLYFITSLVLMRLVTILAQLGLLLGIAMLVFDATLVGNPLLFVGFTIFGGIMFLAIGFALGGVAKTQNSVMLIGNLVIFPQMFLSAVFFPLDAIPDGIAVFTGLLPLSFVAHALREVANEGANITQLWPDVLGVAAWTAIGLFLAIRFFHWSDAVDA